MTMARLNIIFSYLIICCTVVCTVKSGLRGNQSTGKRQRRGPQGDATWKLIDFSNTSISTDHEEVSLNTSEDSIVAHDQQRSLENINAGDDVLQRISERLSALFALEQEQLKRLGSLEYRYTKLEVQTQERTESIRGELREVSRRLQELDWQSNKLESLLETSKIDTAFIKAELEQLRGIISVNNGNSAVKSSPSHSVMETKDKLQSLQVSIQLVRSSLSSLSNEMSTMKRNVTKLMNSSSETLTLSKQFPTAKFFNARFLECKSTAQHRMYAMEKLPAYEKSLPADCWEILQNGHNQSGVYKIRPATTAYSFYVYCQMETHGGGWTVLQNRNDGATDFYKDWQDYKLGFGNVYGEFWLGLHYTYQITSNKLYEILVELKDHELVQVYALYDAFAIGSEIEGYPIKILGKYAGTAGDSLVYHAGQKFSTKDIDNDNWPDGSCAVSHTGAWWYNGCDTSNLNGRYLSGELPKDYEYQGVYWYEWHGPNYSLLETRISIRPRDRFPPQKIPATTTETTNSESDVDE